MHLTTHKESLTDRVLAYQETKDEELLANILDEIKPLVVHIVKSTLRGNSVDYVLYQDADQEAMADLIRAVGSFDADGGSFENYAKVVIKNAALEYLGHFHKDIPNRIWRKIASSRKWPPEERQEILFHMNRRVESWENTFIAGDNEKLNISSLLSVSDFVDDLLESIERKERVTSFYMRLPKTLKQYFIDFFVNDAELEDIMKRDGFTSNGPVQNRVGGLKFLAELYLEQKIKHFDSEICKSVMENTRLSALDIAEFGNRFGTAFYIPRMEFYRRAYQLVDDKIRIAEILKKTGFDKIEIIRPDRSAIKMRARDEIYMFRNENDMKHLLGLALIEKYIRSHKKNQHIDDNRLARRLAERFLPIAEPEKKTEYFVHELISMLGFRMGNSTRFFDTYDVPRFGTRGRKKVSASDLSDKAVPAEHLGDCFFDLSSLADMMMPGFSEINKMVLRKHFIYCEMKQLYVKIGSQYDYVPGKFLPLMIYGIADYKATRMRSKPLSV